MLIISFTNIYSQEKEFIGAISNNTDKTVYTAMQNIWFANEKISYIAILPIINNQITPVIPLREGEGLNKKYVFEASIFNQLPIAMGRNQSNHFWQTSRLTLDFGFNVRMAQDRSNPLVPNNNVVGLGLNKILWNSYTKRNKIKTDSFIYRFENWYDKDIPTSLQVVSLDISVHHYSNGQQGDFFLKENILGGNARRNNYKDGDFSTNYVKAGLTYSYLSKSRNLFSTNLSYQYDGSLAGPLVYSDEQEGNYGHHRLNSFFQFRKTKSWKKDKSVLVYNLCKDSISNTSIHKKSEYILRWENEYIMDNLSDYNISTNNKNRFNQHLYLKYTQPSWRALGIVLHAYYGRDYSNIRYDIPIFALMAGISVDFNKYLIPLSKSQKINYEMIQPIKK